MITTLFTAVDILFSFLFAVARSLVKTAVLGTLLAMSLVTLAIFILVNILR